MRRMPTARRVLLVSLAAIKVSGVVPDKGQSYHVDLAMSRSGDLSGTISTPAQVIKLIIVRGTAYQRRHAHELRW